MSDLKCSELKEDLKENFLQAVSPVLRGNINPKFYKSGEAEALGLNLIKNSNSYVSLQTEKISSDLQKLHNKFEFNQCLTNKKGLFITMKNYYDSVNSDIFEKLPLTFNVSTENDEEFLKFKKIFYEFEADKKKSGLSNI